ncbi:MAG: hypothetical protein WB679_23555 [Terracidiphilus sp.]
MLESVTLNVSAIALAVAVGVPVIAPEEELSERPAGRVPETKAQEYGAVPPVAASAALYVEPTWPFGKDEVVIASAGGVVEALEPPPQPVM